ncbi:MAG: FAD-dependent oxidoreductase [Minisyncoccia bacterium]
MIKEDYEIWLEDINRNKYPRGVLPNEVDFLVIGGGMAGITSAYLLAKQGKQVLLVEKKILGEWVTDCTTGFLTGAIDTDPNKLIKMFGYDQAKLILASHFEAINEIEKIINSEGIECEFERCTNYIYANNLKEEKALIKLAQGYKRLGVPAEYKKENVLKFNDFGYVEMPNHAKFQAMKYLTALAKLATKYGAIIVENTEVLELEDRDDSVNVKIKDVGLVKAKNVVSATHEPFPGQKTLSQLYNIYREYVLEYKLEKNQLEIGTYEDTRSPYNYFRIDRKPDYDRLIIGGADHLNVIKIDRQINFDVMRKYTKGLFANFKLEERRYWSGLMQETNDGLAYIGNLNNSKVFYIFGFSGNGMTYSYIAGKILLDQVLSRSNPYANIYRLNRKLAWWKKLYLK